MNDLATSLLRAALIVRRFKVSALKRKEPVPRANLPRRVDQLGSLTNSMSSNEI